MERQFDTQIEEIKNLILQMGGQVEKCLDEVIQGLVHRDINKFALVHKIEEKINEDHVRVDNSCLNFSIAVLFSLIFALNVSSSFFQPFSKSILFKYLLRTSLTFTMPIFLSAEPFS